MCVIYVTSHIIEGQDASAAIQARDVETKLDDSRSVHKARAGNAQAEWQPDSATDMTQ